MIIISNLESLKHITVLNYNENCVCITVAPGKSIKFEPAVGGVPTTVPLTIDEIRYANNNMAFKSGNLEFAHDMEDEIYEELGIDKDKVIKLKDIRDILISPTKEGLIKILSMTSLSDFDRVRGQFQALKTEGYKLTLDVADFIKRRADEMFRNQIKSNIIVDNGDVIPKDTLRINELEKQIAEMKALLEAKMETSSKVVQSAEASAEPASIEPDAVVEVKTVKKAPGRTKSKTVTK